MRDNTVIRRWIIVALAVLALGLILALAPKAQSAGKEPTWAAVYCMDGTAYVGKLTDFQKWGVDLYRVTLEDDITLWTHPMNLTLMDQKPDYLDNDYEGFIGKERGK